MPRTTVSVVIPTIDSHVQTRKAVLSALAQTAPIMEVIVVNDGGSDRLDARALGDGDPRVRVINLPSNRGAAAARQVGVEASRGHFLAFLDSDDLWFPEKLASQLDLLLSREKHGAFVAVVCGWITNKGPGQHDRTRLPIPSTSVLDFASGCWYCPGSTLVASREVFLSVGPIDHSLRRLEDFDWGLRFALAGGKLRVAPIIGARIQPSGRACLAQVASAARTLRARYCNDQRLSSKAQRSVMAYLALEQAAAAKSEGDYARVSRQLVRSFCLRPRLSLPLRRWWR